MRKVLILFLCLVLSEVIQAQTSKGNFQFGIANNRSRQDFVSNNININPVRLTGGFFLTNNISTGVMLGYRRTITGTLSSGATNILDQKIDRVFEYGAYARFHKPLSKKLYVYLQPTILFGTGTTDLDYTVSADLNTFHFMISPGITYFLTERWAFEMSFSGMRYTRQELEGGPGAGQRYGEWDTNANFNNMSFGVSFYLK